MNGDHFILDDGHNVVPCDLLTWAAWFDNPENPRVVAQTTVGDVRVSTVFLGLDHAFGNGPPLLFETMVFGGPLDGEQDRYTTWEQAANGHAAMLRRVERR